MCEVWVINRVFGGAEVRGDVDPGKMGCWL